MLVAAMVDVFGQQQSLLPSMVAVAQGSGDQLALWGNFTTSNNSGGLCDA